MTEYIKKEDVLKIIYDVKENKDVPKNYGTLIDIIQQIRNLSPEKVISKNMGKCELAVYQNNNLHTDCNYCIELARVEAYQEITNKLHIAFDKHFGTGFYKRSCRDVIDDVLKERIGDE